LDARRARVGVGDGPGGRRHRHFAHGGDRVSDVRHDDDLDRLREMGHPRVGVLDVMFTERYDTVFILSGTGDVALSVEAKLYGDDTMMLKNACSYCSLTGVWTAVGGVPAGIALPLLPKPWRASSRTMPMCCG